MRLYQEEIQSMYHNEEDVKNSNQLFFTSYKHFLEITLDFGSFIRNTLIKTVDNFKEADNIVNIKCH